jgi:hypothetical protein
VTIVRQPLPGHVQSRYYPDRDVLLIDPTKVPRDGEHAVIQQTLLVLAGRDDLAPYARRVTDRRHLHAVPEPAGYELVDGVG